MSITWTFSQSSEALLQRCIDAAQPLDEKNKWVQKFGLKQKELVDVDNVIEISQDTIDDPPTEPAKSGITPDLNMEVDEELLDTIDAEPVQRFDIILEECARNVEFITKLAEKLSVSSIEKVCHHVLQQQHGITITEDFIDVFYVKFFPTYLKREQSLSSLDLLIQAEKFRPSIFKKLLHILLKDLGIPSKILQEFIQTRNDEQKFDFFNNLMEVDLTEEQFRHNLFTIYTLFMEVKKSESIQNYILSNIIKNAQLCSDEKNFGRLILAYLQQHNNIIPVDCAKLYGVLEIHRTPFKKPCLNLLKEHCEK